MLHFELDTKQKRWDIETRMRDKHEIEPRNNATEENKNEVKPGHHTWQIRTEILDTEIRFFNIGYRYKRYV